INLPNIARIDEEAFYRCVALTKTELGDNIKVVGNNAFRNTNLSYIDLKQAEEIRAGAFKSCTHLFQIRITNLNVLKNKANVVEGCEDLKNITLTQGTVSAKKYPFTKVGCEYSIESIKDNERIRLLSGNSAADVYRISQKISGESFDEEEYMSDIYVTDGGDMVAVKKKRTTGFKYVCRGDAKSIKDFLKM
ncbi:MAG: leucine-rich repeat protein, partial [Ruminococcus sp.]|nr:leucine-rich repeat protein [Ruminococcus sp.]